MFLPTLLKNYSKRTIFITILLIIGGVFIFFRAAQAVSFLGFDLNLETTILGWVGHLVKMLVGLLGGLLLIIIDLLIKVYSFNHFIDGEAIAVEIGWVLVRDLSNIFFVVSLLVIAFATVFNVESYHYKKMLPKLIIMAVLVNFSKTICGLIIDFAQVVMMTFVHSFESISRGNLAFGFGLDQMLAIIDGSQNNVNVDFSSGSIVASYILAVLYLIVALGVVGTMLIIIVFRIIMIWALVVLSPIAFMASAVPGGEKYSGQWWSEFTKNVISGPFLAFFFWLSMLVLYKSNGLNGATVINIETVNPNETAITQTGTSNTMAATVTKISTGPAIFNYIVSISLLIASMVLSQQLGVAGGSAGGKFMGHLQSFGLGVVGGLVGGALAPLRLGKWGAEKGYEWGAGKVLQKSTEEGSSKFWKPFKYFYKSTWEGFGERGGQMREESKRLATAYGHQMADKIYTRGKLKIPRVELTQSGIMEEYEKKFAPLSKEQMMNMSRGVKKLSGFEGEMSRVALLRSAAAKGYVDDLMTEFAPELAKLAREKYGMGDDDGNTPFHTHALMNEFLYDYTSDKAVGSGQGREAPSRAAMTLMNDLEDIAKAVKHPEYDGHSDFDTKTGQWKALNPIVITLNDQGQEDKQYVWSNNNWRRATKNHEGEWVEDAENKEILSQKELHQLYTNRRVMYDIPGQREHMINEFRKWGGSRQIAQVAPHPITTMMYNEKTGAKSLGGPILDVGQEQILKDISSANVVYDAGYKQPRHKVWLFGGQEPKLDGGYVVVDEAHAKSMQEMYDRGGELWMNTVYGELMGFQARDASNIRGFRLKVVDNNGNEVSKVTLGDPEYEKEIQILSQRIISKYKEEHNIGENESLPPDVQDELNKEINKVSSETKKSKSKFFWSNIDKETRSTQEAESQAKIKRISSMAATSTSAGTTPTPGPTSESRPIAPPTPAVVTREKIDKMASQPQLLDGNDAVKAMQKIYQDEQELLKRMTEIVNHNNPETILTAQERETLKTIDLAKALQHWKHQLS